MPGGGSSRRGAVLALTAAAAGLGLRLASAAAAAAALAATTGAECSGDAGDGGAQRPLRLGCVGVGTINSAVVRGLCTSEGRPVQILVGPRNTAKAAALVAQFADQVTQASSSQEVLDGSDIILLATPPGPASLQQVAAGLTFRPDHRVICIVAGVSYDLIKEVTAPAASATIALPLPPAEWHASTTPVFPRDELTEALMGRLGHVIALDSFEQLSALSVGALMGHFYKTLQTVEGYLVKHGFEPEAAAAATGSYYNTFNQASKVGRAGLFAELVAEQTPGGLNEQVIREVEEGGGFALVEQAMDNIRLRKAGK